MIVCPHCGFQNADGRQTCKQCRKAFTEPVAAISVAPLAPAERQAVLQRAIVSYVGGGWTLIGQTETTATLTKKGAANGLITLLLLLLAILPGVLYALLARPTLTLYLQVDEFGKIVATQGSA